ncbi:hypothetical protein TWF970_011395 [Orbilia oligospora]|uniref:Methyltransferase type 11 domain-containing protein n=1 Tax=Orbilia oligospora TaxID=2813651 RepID=A0A7C8VIH1_ORBOL|nr:hypothetical protein TWF970_011395 [Orbilia oligospora]
MVFQNTTLDNQLETCAISCHWTTTALGRYHDRTTPYTHKSYFSTSATNIKMSSSVHPVADAFSTSGSSGLYEKARPSYPAESLSKIFTAFHKSIKNNKTDGGINVVELGAGTGIFTRLLISPPETTPEIPQINKIVAVEPGPGMREGFISALTKKNISVGTTGVKGEEKVQILPGTFDSIPVEDAWADGIVIAQAFHWSHGHYENALKEIARVLKPGAPLVLIWNLEDRSIPEFHPWVAKLRDIYEQYENGTPQYRLGWWKAIFDLPEYKELYQEEYEKYKVQRLLSATVDGVVQRILSKSYITALSEEDKVQVEKNVREAMEKERKEWDDEGKGVFKYPYATDLYIIWKK